MAKYIDADKLIKAMKKTAEITGRFGDAVNAFEACVKLMPAADVVEVKHGYWKPLPAQSVTGTLNVEAECSNCGREVVYQIVNNRYEFENFCPHCGVKM